MFIRDCSRGRTPPHEDLRHGPLQGVLLIIIIIIIVIINIHNINTNIYIYIYVMYISIISIIISSSNNMNNRWHHLVADKWGQHLWGRCESDGFWLIGEKGTQIGHWGNRYKKLTDVDRLVPNKYPFKTKKHKQLQWPHECRPHLSLSDLCISDMI